MDESVAARAKAKAKRVAGTRPVTGRTGHASGTAQNANVRSGQIFTAFRNFPYKAKGCYSYPGQSEA